jgi:transcriptional regulator with XRE-family HTH domain
VFVVRGRKNPLFMGLAARLKTARKTAALNRQSVTQRAKLSDVSAVLGIEQGQRIPRLDTVERVAYALGLSPALLAYGIEAAAETYFDKSAADRVVCFFKKNLFVIENRKSQCI